MEVKQTPKLSILVPVRNEGPHLLPFLKSLKSAVTISHEVLMIHDEDEVTGLSAVHGLQPDYPGLQAVCNTYGPGISPAIRFGIDVSKGDYILILVADDPGPLAQIMRMTALLDEGYDLVAASRYGRGGQCRGGHPMGRRLSRLANRWFQQLSPLPLSDATCGIKMFRRHMLTSFSLKATVGAAVAFELAIKAYLHNYKITEVPITSCNRLDGERSHKALGPWIWEYGKWFLWGVSKT